MRLQFHSFTAILGGIRSMLMLGSLVLVSTAASASDECRPDIDGNKAIDARDLAMLLDAWGTASNDLTGDGVVSANDVAALLNRWGPCACTTTIDGRVLFSNGTPAVGASVTSSLGGSTVSNGKGVFHLTAEYPWNVNAAELSAQIVVGGLVSGGVATATPLIAGGTSGPITIFLHSDCAPSLRPRFGALPGVNTGSGPQDGVFDSAVYDAGFGPELILWGNFSQAGAVATPEGMAAFDGHRWRRFGTGVFRTALVTPASETEGVLAVVNGELYIGGNFTHVNGLNMDPANHLARWDRVLGRWVALPAGYPTAGRPTAMAGVDFGDGLGVQLVVGNSAATQPVYRLNGSVWQSLGAPNISIEGLAVQPQPTGPRIFAVGARGSTSGSPVAQWTAGTTWTTIPVSSPTSARHCATIYNGDLYVGGAGVNNIPGLSRWDGQSWQTLLGNIGSVECLAAFTDQSGSYLYAGVSNGSSSVYRGSIAGFSALAGTPTPGVSTLAPLAVGGQPVLFAGGVMSSLNGAATVTQGVARYEGGSWRPVGSGLGGSVATMISRVEGGTSVAYIGGLFSSADGVQLSGVARWNGAHFEQLGNGLVGEVRALCFHDAGDGTGERLYAISGHSTLSRWMGSSWQAIPTGLSSQFDDVTTMLSVADGAGNHDLYLGGKFSLASIGANGVMRWRNGSAWQAVGDGLNSGTTNVRALGQFVIHGERALFVCGDLGTSGSGTPLNHIARLDPDTNSWRALGQGLYGPAAPAAMVMVERGGKLYVGGIFDRITDSQQAADGIAIWDGLSWAPMIGANGETGFRSGLFRGGVNAHPCQGGRHAAGYRLGFSDSVRRRSRPVQSPLCKDAIHSPSWHLRYSSHLGSSRPVSLLQLHVSSGAQARVGLTSRHRPLTTGVPARMFKSFRFEPVVAGLRQRLSR